MLKYVCKKTDILIFNKSINYYFNCFVFKMSENSKTSVKSDDTFKYYIYIFCLTENPQPKIIFSLKSYKTEREKT